MKNRYSKISIIFFVIIGVVPFSAAFIYALLYSFGIVGVVNDGFTTEFWVAVIERGEFFKSFFYSAIVAGVAVFISVALALWMCLKFVKEMDKKFLSFAIYLPLAVPSVVSAFFTYQLFSKSGFFSRFAYKFGWITESRQFPDLVNDQWAIGIMLTFITVVMPLFLLVFLNVYKNERLNELSELSYTLGATERQTAWRVSIPILLKKTGTLIGLYFVFMIGAYEVPLILGQESPQMLSVLVIREIKQYDLNKISEGYVIAVIYTFVVATAAILLFNNKKNAVDEI